MPLEIEPRSAPPATRPAGAPVVIALVNNMPDAALLSTESQFSSLLQDACGDTTIRLRLTSLPEMPRSPEALQQIREAYPARLSHLMQGQHQVVSRQRVNWVSPAMRERL